MQELGTDRDVPVEDLKVFEANPREMDSSTMAELEASIRTYGFLQPVIARKSDKLVLGGHQRLQAAKNIGSRNVPVTWVDGTDIECIALNLALNNIQGTWENKKLAAILEDLTPYMDQYPTGFELEDVPVIMADQDLDYSFGDDGGVMESLGSPFIDKKDRQFESRTILIKVEDAEEFYRLVNEKWGLSNTDKGLEWGDRIMEILRGI